MTLEREQGPGAAYASFELLAPPRSMTVIPSARVTARVLEPEPEPEPAARAGQVAIRVQVTSDETALFVGLVSRAQGQFSENYFILPKGATRTVLFRPNAGTGTREQLELLRSSLRADHVALHLPVLAG